MNDETTEPSEDDHKPECPMLDPQFPKHPLDNCDYCKMISRCEKRVRGEVIRENGDWIQMPTLALDQIKQHAAEAMRAACIAAVEEVDGEQAVLVFRRHVLAALKEVQP